MDNQQAFAIIAKELEPLGVEPSKMFGMPTWKLNGKAFGGPWETGIVFKLTDEKVLKEALDLPDVVHFEPMAGRPMKQWVLLGYEHADRWPYFAEKAAKSKL